MLLIHAFSSNVVLAGSTLRLQGASADIKPPNTVEVGANTGCGAGQPAQRDCIASYDGLDNGTQELCMGACARPLTVPNP